MLSEMRTEIELALLTVARSDDEKNQRRCKRRNRERNIRTWNLSSSPEPRMEWMLGERSDFPLEHSLGLERAQQLVRRMVERWAQR